MTPRGGGRWGGPADKPWDEVIPRLWQGGSMQAIPSEMFDHVLTLDAEVAAKYPPPPGTTGEVWDIVDGPMPDPLEVHEHARALAERHLAGEVLLIRCAAGQNRSGLVTARVLVELGYDVADAVKRIRNCRGPHALSNRHFTRWLLSSA